MFSRILIANRGEIACRVIRTARAMGIASVAVYSDADRDACHVMQADTAIRIGPAPSDRSYLDIGAIVAAARDSGAEAVHPGYGFLSENPDFARALGEAGIVFIGPGVNAIEVMGDKIAAKAFAASVGVATVPGHGGVVATAQEAAGAASGIGYPVMLKASAGGGGKGMRVANDERELVEGFASAANEARAAFGDERLFVEAFIAEPRHIEVQILADRHGNVVHLGERECSIQRRNQKIIEEAPSPFVDQVMRERMGAQAVALAKAVAYESAGTVEFIVDRERNFYFLEMNTRLQVEHPVTELVTGRDIVAEMIRIAAGEALSFGQDDVRLEGWAVEARICAEDPMRGFLPSTGRLVRYRPPRAGTADGLTVRVDTGVEEGGTVSVHYDPMIAKLCTHGPSRAAAIDRMQDALDRFTIVGISHNVAFLSAVMAHPRWREGRLSTAFIAEEYPAGPGTDAADEATLDLLVAVAAVIDHIARFRRAGPPRGAAQARIVELGGHQHPVSVTADGDTYTVGIGSRAVTLATGWRPGALVFEAVAGDRAVAVQVRPVAGGRQLTHRGARLDSRVFSPREAELGALMPPRPAPDTSKSLLCPMPGTVVSINASPGQVVEPGEPLCVVEAMKMENVLRADREVTVAAVLVAPGDSLAVDAVIMEFE